LVKRSAEAVADDSLAWLLEAAQRLPPADLAGAVAEALARIGAISSCLFLADHDQMSLHPFRPIAEEPPALRVDGTVAGRTFALEMTCTVPTDGGVRLWVPVVDGTARLGVLGVDLTSEDAQDAQTLSSVERVAALAAQLVVDKSAYSDVVELVQRNRKMSLAAELQRSTLPPLAMATPDVVVAGILEPAYEVAGDTFDYALNADALHVAVIDSVGHDIGSSIVSHLVHGSLRNSRRHGLDLPEVYTRANAALTTVFRDLTFATAAFGHLDLGSGLFSWVSAGHPPPLVVRGGKVVHEADTVPVVPIGLDGVDPTVNELVLEPGDMLLLYTDGVVEGGAPGTERFGLDRLADLLSRNLLAELSPAETLRRLVRAVLEHSAHELRDDLTMVLVEYRAAVTS
jgi:serine phosphatase RsbU (regulator of sigma subunit)